MTILIIVGVICLLLGWLFNCLNTDTPVQSCIPTLLFPLGVGLLLVALGGWWQA